LENSYKYFENRDCAFYPCHDMEEINCLFCFCPLYEMEECPGDPVYAEHDGKRVRICNDCRYPHDAVNYEDVMELLKERFKY